MVGSSVKLSAGKLNGEPVIKTGSFPVLQQAHSRPIRKDPKIIFQGCKIFLLIARIWKI
jgi:hypothetical protein